MNAGVPKFEPILTAQEKREMRGQLFCQREFVGVDLAEADLRGARFVRTIIDTCNLEGADLRGALFIECDLRALVLRRAKFGENRFDGTILSDIVGLSDGARLSIERKGGEFQPPPSHR